MKSHNPIFDVLIIGGGPAGTASAEVFVKNGLKVAMIDGGNIQTTSEFETVENFETIRRTYIDQYKFFLGEDLSGINLDSISHISNQATGNKRHLIKDVKDKLPVKSTNVEILQNLAKGGLTEIWGANCDFFQKNELEEIGLPASEMPKYYQDIVNAIGVSGISKQYKMLPPVKIDHNARYILERYKRKPSEFTKLGLDVHPPYLGILSKNKGLRQKGRYTDTEYWSDIGKSVYRARYSIEELEKRRNFFYIKGVVVSVKDTGKVVIIETVDQSYFSKVVVLAAGPLSTGRILVRSFGLYNVKFPILTKYSIISPCLLFANLNKRGDTNKHSFCQLVMENTNTNIDDYSYTQFYSYKSLLLFKLLKYLKLPLPESLSVLSIISSALVLADTRVGCDFKNSGYYFLKKEKNNKEVLNIVYKKAMEGKNLKGSIFKKVKKGFKELGLFALKHVYMPFGSTAHYAGTLSKKGGNKLLNLDKNGKLERSARIYIADASGWDALPAKPPTLTIMANARRVATSLVKSHKSL